MEKTIIQILQHLGENPNRDGLKDTPHRVVKSWGEIYGGYQQDPKKLFTIFPADGYDQIIFLKDIELYSMCEHHMLPFFGKAFVAYLPDKKIIGISKLARLVDIFARRLQIQERIGQQVTDCLMEMLQPKGAACIIEATHMCMRMRGCNKQNTVMGTSSVQGIFKDDPTVKSELMQLYK
jgi:GTP cyclohydrolase I